VKVLFHAASNFNMRDEMSKKNLLSFLLVLIVVLAGVFVYALLRGPSEPD